MLISSMGVGVLEDVLHESMKRIPPPGFLPFSAIRNSPVPVILRYVQFNGVWNGSPLVVAFWLEQSTLRMNERDYAAFVMDCME